MGSNFRNQYFVFVKSAGILGLLFWGLTEMNRNLYVNCGAFLMGAVFLFCSVMYELSDGKKQKIFWIGEGILAAGMVFLFPVIGIYYAAVSLFDRMERFSHAWISCGLLLVLLYGFGIGGAAHGILLVLLFLLYCQQKYIIEWYKRQDVENQRAEYRLKNYYKDELKQSRLHYENILLQEKGRISQALHDKLGHSINGSLYKLEAAKLLIDKRPRESGTILQEVIDNLRGSMDEIRVILRNEKPDKKRMALMSLQTLCEECEEQYHIQTVLEVEQEEGVIPEKIWEIILDNTFEAVTNSLKYSGCGKIEIHIVVLGEVVRCTIRDDGKGAADYEDGMGIQGMKKRVRDARGYLDIESEAGFVINMILPIGGKDKKNGTDSGDYSGRQ